MAEEIAPRPRRDGARRPGGSPQRAPKNLSAESKKLWDSIVAEWVLDAPALEVLHGGLEARDQARLCRAGVVKHGVVFLTETGFLRPNPSARLELAYLAEFRQAIRQLGLQPAED